MSPEASRGALVVALVETSAEVLADAEVLANSGAGTFAVGEGAVGETALRDGAVAIGALCDAAA